jgi:hypothetical protein
MFNKADIPSKLKEFKTNYNKKYTEYLHIEEAIDRLHNNYDTYYNYENFTNYELVDECNTRNLFFEINKYDLLNDNQFLKIYLAVNDKHNKNINPENEFQIALDIYSFGGKYIYDLYIIKNELIFLKNMMIRLVNEYKKK